MIEDDEKADQGTREILALVMMLLGGVAATSTRCRHPAAARRSSPVRLDRREIQEDTDWPSFFVICFCNNINLVLLTLQSLFDVRTWRIGWTTNYLLRLTGLSRVHHRQPVRWSPVLHGLSASQTYSQRIRIVFDSVSEFHPCTLLGPSVRTARKQNRRWLMWVLCNLK